MIKAKELTILEIILFVGVNVLGILLYIVFVYQIEQGQIAAGRQDYDFSDSLTYLVEVLPILIVCALLNAILVGRGIVTAQKLKTYRRWPIVGFNVGFWAFIFVMEASFKFTSQSWDWWNWNFPGSGT